MYVDNIRPSFLTYQEILIAAPAKLSNRLHLVGGQIGGQLQLSIPHEGCVHGEGVFVARGQTLKQPTVVVVAVELGRGAKAAAASTSLFLF